ncbi:MAG: tRNA (adenosine(37)-N6)-dimethylallyltransferase MiaA [Anaerolineae bacterium]|nr:tRNA (adenosine(37)-N6)-dimethylallyltransferase MiaA [Anaerolineae bacterium]
MSVKAKLVIVIGPTAVGKSAKAMELAAQLDGEIISADSRHVYRGMTIGTNKPTADEQARVRHHLLDLRDPHEPFSLSEYLDLARAAIDDVSARGKTPMLVGGTGQYVRAVIEGWQVPEVPPNEDIRRRWTAYAEAHGAEALNRELIKLDPAAATTIDPRNVRRVIRALEVIEVTGQKWSDLQRKSPMDSGLLQIVNVALPREVLYERADARILQMVRDGWLDETRQLLQFLASVGIDAAKAKTLPSMSALGYTDMIEVALGQLSMDEAITRIKADTRRFIRMQDAWFRPYWK